MLKLIDSIDSTWELWEKMGMELEELTKTFLDIKVSGKPHKGEG